MKPVAIALLLFASLCCTRECYPQDAGDFHPATTNVWGAEYPRVDSAGRAQIRVRAPDATKVKVNFWSGPKSDMEKQSDGYWMVNGSLTSLCVFGLPFDSEKHTVAVWSFPSPLGRKTPCAHK